MKKLILILSSLVFLSSCAGVNIKPITKEQDTTDLRKSLNGYIVYSPKHNIKVTNIFGNCIIENNYIPDYSKPFTIELESGLGKFEGSIKIKDGWMLETVTVKTDNTSIPNGVIGLFANDDSKKIPAGNCKILSGIYTLEEIKKIQNN